MTKPIRAVEGIGLNYAQALAAAGITTTESLLRAGHDRQGRQQLATQTGLTETAILKWVNMCDLFRIKGVASQYAELLETAGVDTVKELRNRNAENLTEKMAEINAAQRLVRQVPTLKLVQGWIEQAQKLEPMITH